jgi:predicted dehydrogenase
MGEKVAAAAADHPQAVVGAVAERDASRRAELESAFGCPAFSSWEEALDSDGLDAVYIGLPHQLHATAACAAAERGLHILLDKPMCNTLPECDRILDAVERAGVRLMVGFSHRFRDDVRRTRDAVRSGGFGTLMFASDLIVEASPKTPSWYWDPSAGGGVVQLQMHHSFDRLAWLMDSRIVAVRGELFRRQVIGSAAVDVAAAATLHFANGVVGTSAASFAGDYRTGGSAELLIQGSAGHARLDTGRSLEVHTAGRARREEVLHDDWLAVEVDEFVSSVAQGREPSVTGVDGRRALLVALALRESSATGAMVEVPE